MQIFRACHLCTFNMAAIFGGGGVIPTYGVLPYAMMKVNIEAFATGIKIESSDQCSFKRPIRRVIMNDNACIKST